MNPIQVIYVLASVTAFYVLFYRMKVAEARLTRLENQKPKPESKAVEKTKQVLVFLDEIENFTPKKPETLRPNQVRGREVLENVYEFDAKI